MSDTLELVAEAREDVGKGASRRLRREKGQMPAVVYGAKDKAQSLTLRHDDLLHALEEGSIYSQVFDLIIGKNKQPVVLKALQRHPFKPKLIHADFQRVDVKKALTVAIPVEFIGEAAGVKEGGIFMSVMAEIEVTALPANLPEKVEVDISELETGSSVHLQEIPVPADCVFAALVADEEANPLVASVQVPKAAAEPEPVEGEEGEVAEGEAASDDSAESGDDAASDKGEADKE